MQTKGINHFYDKEDLEDYDVDLIDLDNYEDNNEDLINIEDDELNEDDLDFLDDDNLFNDMNDNDGTEDISDRKVILDRKEESTIKKEDNFINERPLQNSKKEGKLLLTEREREVIAEENQALIKHTTKIYYDKFGHSFKLTFDDIFGVATFGFTKALLTYDKNNVAKFSTYAVTCMRNEILLTIRKEKNRLSDISIDFVLSNDKNGNQLTLEQIIDDVGCDVESLILGQEQNNKVLEAIQQSLTKKEQIIALLRFGIGCNEHTQKQVADVVKMSQANISKTERTIKNKIKDYLEQNYSMDL